MQLLRSKLKPACNAYSKARRILFVHLPQEVVERAPQLVTFHERCWFGVCFGEIELYSTTPFTKQRAFDRCLRIDLLVGDPESNKKAVSQECLKAQAGRN